MAKKAADNDRVKRPITVEDHKELNRRNEAKNINAVNAALGFPNGDAFENDLTEILNSDCEEKGETVVIALIDFDNFLHINDDFGREAGDKVLIDTGLYIKENAPKDAKVYRIGGDEFGIIFKGLTEREDIFLFLNDLKNNFNVKTPDGAAQTLTIGMATAFVDASRCAELIRKADGALYRAKVGGRNKGYEGAGFNVGDGTNRLDVGPFDNEGSSVWTFHAVRRTDDGVITVYQGRSNGILGWTSGTFDGFTFATGLPFCIGQDGTGGYGKKFVGGVDDFALWTRGLTHDDIRRIHDAGRKGHDLGSLVKAR